VRYKDFPYFLLSHGPAFPILIRICIADTTGAHLPRATNLSNIFHGMTQNVMPQYNNCHAMENSFSPNPKTS